MRTIDRPAFIAAPLLMLVYGVFRIIDGFDGERGPGPAWTIGHLAFLGALGLFIWIFREMRAMIGPRARITAVVATLGVSALVGQFVVDIVAGLLADDHAGMSAMMGNVAAVPGVSFAIYDVLPLLFYIGQLALAVQLSLHRHVKAWMPLLVLASLTVPLIDKDLIPVGAVLLLVSFLPLARTARVPAPALV